MNKEFITRRQAMAIIGVFIFGNTVVIGGYSKAQQDSWICLLLSQVISIPIILIYSRIMNLYPEKGLFEIIEILFGKVFSKILAILMIWFSIHIASLSAQNFSQFMQIISLYQSPLLPIIMLIILSSLYLAKSGVQTLAKWSVIAYAVVVLVVAFSFILLLSKMDFSNFLPIMNHNFNILFEGAIQIFTFPFGETIIFLALADSIRKNENPYGIFIVSVLSTIVVFLFIVTRNIATLGPILIQHENFPSYVTVRLIELGEFMERIEGSVAVNFVLNGITKIAVCIIAASKGIASLLNLSDYKKLVAPVSLTVLAIASILYKTISEMMIFIKVFIIYSIPFEIIIPIAIWITAEIKKHKKPTVPIPTTNKAAG